ncbi:uncharacterized protein LOC124370388 [Homalodisca vitripennis]|uniref:uncharacterized protein LOC124370388 n=1 Tax=Homalodisca vitripennis TaxID=197043 RepID=UPI001EEAAFD0|nr:uncharacterized protein LOC124370388 [Homalodisca vitripennis]
MAVMLSKVSPATRQWSARMEYQPPTIGTTTTSELQMIFKLNIPAIYSKSQKCPEIAVILYWIISNFNQTAIIPMTSKGTNVVVNYDIVMEVPAIVTVIEPPYSEMHLQVFFLRNGVYGLYECDTYFTEEGSYTAGVMIRVLNYDKNNKLQSDSIQSAMAILNKLNLNDGVVVPTDCP